MNFLAIYGSPRQGGNTDILMDELTRGAEGAGALVGRVYLRKLKISPCLEIYGCMETGRCVIRDDFQRLYDQMAFAHMIALSSPIFFYAVSAHTKIMMDRCQAAFVNKYCRNQRMSEAMRPGIFIAVGATKGKQLFDGVLLSVHYFFDAIDVELKDTILVRGVDKKGAISRRPAALKEAFEIGMKWGKGSENSLLVNRERK
jgi:multimeric flavodoxin WrbA